MSDTIATTTLADIVFPADSGIAGGETINGFIEQIYNGTGTLIAVDSTIVMTETASSSPNNVTTETFSTNGTVSNSSTITSTDSSVNGNSYVQNHGNVPNSSGFASYEIFMPETSKTGMGPTWDEIHLDWKEIPTAANSPFLYSGTYNGRTTVLEYGGQPQEDLGNSLGTETSTIQVTCFLSGTQILTAKGEIGVEMIKVGDEIVLNDGSTAPAVWIGKRAVNAGLHSRPEAVLPVVILAGALGDGLPLRDLYVSPDHALLLDGYLVPAKALINGVSIRRHKIDRFSYYHVELPHHAVLYAEGVPAESYLETGNRDSFENGSAAVKLHPDFAQSVREAAGCAPFAESGPVVEAIRVRILARARIVTTDDPQLQVVAKAGGAVLRSRSAMPGELTADPRDRRVLGVKVAALMVGGKNIPLDHPDLTAGWHDAEPDGRWTDGAAEIPASLVRGARQIAVALSGTVPYPIGRAV